MIIECEVCESRPGVDHDCMVAFLTDPARQASPVHMDADQAAAVAHMVRGGLIQPLHLVPPLTSPESAQPIQTASIKYISRVS